MISDYQQLPASVGPFGSGTESVAISNIVDSGAGGNLPQGRVLRGVLNVSIGAAGTAFTLKCRQGTTVAGAQVGVTSTYTIPTASTPVTVAYSFQDNSAAGAGAYCITITGTGGTATVNDGCLEIFVPDPYGSAG
jgi:hypothetical protein